MRLVDDDREAAIPVQRADIVEDEGEFLNRRDDDLLAVGDEAPQVAGMLGVADGRADLRELLDGVADLLIENAPIGDHDHRVEYLAFVLGEPDQLVRQPGDGVRLARSRRMLDQHPPPRALRPGIGQQLADDIELMETREQLVALHLAGFRVPPLNDLGDSSR